MEHTQAQGLLISCRSHYDRCYLAYLFSQELNANGEGHLGYDGVGIFTGFDGGGGRCGQNQVAHVFLQYQSVEDNLLVKVKLDDEYWSFELKLPLEPHLGYPEASFEEVWHEISAKIKELWSGTRECNLTENQLKHALDFEKVYFSNWGQGNAPMFD